MRGPVPSPGRKRKEMNHQTVLAGEVYTQGSGSYHINEDGTLKMMRPGGQR